METTSVMAEAESALREELEKVRERSRLQALAQGLAPDAAEQRGNAAVQEFCAKWGIRPEMLGPARGGRPGASAEPPKAATPPPRPVDLGSSPLRSSMNPGATQAIRISDLLKKARDESGAPAGNEGPAPAPARPPSALTGLLQRVKSQNVFESLPRPPAPAPRPAGPGPTPTPTRPPLGPGRTSADPLSATQGGTPLPQGPGVAADRRRQILEEFDRTYAEVQTMIEQRIGVGDVALSEVLSAVPGPGAGSATPQDIAQLAADVARLRTQLEGMVGLCDDFLDRFRGTPGGGM